MEPLANFVEANQALLTWIGAGSALLLIVSIVLIPVVAIRLPVDYFTKYADSRFPDTPLKIAVMAFRNLTGLAFLLLGIAMIVLPGPGLLTIAFGISLLDFPAKRKVLARLLSFSGVRRSLNWFREKANREPLSFPER